MMPERIFEFARVSLDLGYDVEIIVCDDYPTMRYGDPYQPARCGVVQKLISIIDSINVKADGSHSYTYDDCKDGRRTLLVVAYIGHGGKWDITTPTEPDSKTVLLGGQ